MAPPRHRDRGFSRRIQYGLFFGYVAATAGIVAGLALLLIARFNPVTFDGIRGLALDLTAPITRATRPIVLGAGSVRQEIRDYLNAGAQNNALREQLGEARRALVHARVLAAQNAQLRRIARLVEQDPSVVVTARVIGSDLVGSRRVATLAAGSAEGVRRGQPVRTADGLIGRIAETGTHAARIVLLSDGGITVPLRIVRTGAPALADGRGDGTLDLRATGGAHAFRRGDLLVTSGVGGVYPPDMPVAVVTATSGEIATGRPLADPARLDFAIVLPEAMAPPAVAPPAGRTHR